MRQIIKVSAQPLTSRMYKNMGREITEKNTENIFRKFVSNQNGRSSPLLVPSNEWGIVGSFLLVCVCIVQASVQDLKIKLIQEMFKTSSKLS